MCSSDLGTWFALTQKLNGVRATFYKGKLYARSGVPYEGLDHITDILSSNKTFSGLVFDGELTLIDKGDLSDNEAFRKATGIINSDDVDKTAICYTIFDVINTPEFESDKCVIAYFKSYEEQKPSLNPPFSSVYVCMGLLPKQIVFEEIKKV